MLNNPWEDYLKFVSMVINSIKQFSVQCRPTLNILKLLVIFSSHQTMCKGSVLTLNGKERLNLRNSCIPEHGFCSVLFCTGGLYGNIFSKRKRSTLIKRWALRDSRWCYPYCTKRKWRRSQSLIHVGKFSLRRTRVHTSHSSKMKRPSKSTSLATSVLKTTITYFTTCFARLICLDFKQVIYKKKSQLMSTLSCMFSPLSTCYPC